jgi:hypothetical protein
VSSLQAAQDTQDGARSADDGPASVPAKLEGGAATASTPSDGVLGDVGPSDAEEKAEAEALRTFDGAVKRVWEQLPANALLIVMTCMGDTPEVRRLRVRAPQEFNF